MPRTASTITTVPLAPLVTPVTVRPASSNESLASTFTVTGVSSLVLVVSSRMSTTGVTVTVTVAVSVSPLLSVKV